MAEVQFRDTAAAGYDRSVGVMTRRIVPALLHAARLAPGQRVLDIATGTGLAADAAAEAVGLTGHVLAADISPAMVAKARDRLGERPNVSCAVEDAQALTLADEHFDAVICNMGLMYLPDPARGVAEFRRVLRPDGRVAASVFTRADRALAGGLVRAAIARHVPAKAAEAAHFYSVGEEGRLRRLFEAAALRGIETAVEKLRFTYADFDDFFGGVERGEGAMGQEYTALPEDHAKPYVRRSAGRWAERLGRWR
jgi:ubiquinone/menaquinone biosynthesis C-methylase UbiE